MLVNYYALFEFEACKTTVVVRGGSEILSVSALVIFAIQKEFNQ